jgi:hypothetical protein
MSGIRHYGVWKLSAWEVLKTLAHKAWFEARWWLKRKTNWSMFDWNPPTKEQFTREKAAREKRKYVGHFSW